MNTYDTVLDILKELSATEAILPEQSLQDDLGLDSIQLVTLLIEIEDRFEILLDESDMNPFELTTVKDVVDLVERYEVSP